MRLFAAVIWCGLVLAGCYEKPAIPVTHPVSCTAANPQCPLGYGCVADRVCALKSCATAADCPTDLVCNAGRGCVLPSAPDGSVGRADGGASVDAGATVGAADAGVGFDTVGDLAEPSDGGGQ